MSYPFVILRRYATAIAVVLLCLMVIWGVLWTLASAQFNSLIDAWQVMERAKGGQLTFASRTTGGFPTHVSVTFSGLEWRTAGGHQAKVQNLTLAARPWTWRNIEMSFDGATEAVIPYPDAADPLLINGMLGGGELKLNHDDVAHYLKATLRDVKVRRQSHELYTAEEMSLAAHYPDHAPKDYTETGLTIEAAAKTMKVVTAEPLPLGNDIDQFATTLRVMGKLPDPYNRDSVNNWSNASGVVEFDSYRLQWGPMQLDVKGTLALDDDLQPEGAFAGQIAGHEEIVKALLEHQWITPRQGGMLNSALKLFAKPGQLTTRPSIEVPITVQLGGLYLGPVRIFMFPEIGWPKSATASTVEPVTESSPPVTEAPPE